MVARKTYEVGLKHDLEGKGVSPAKRARRVAKLALSLPQEEDLQLMVGGLNRLCAIAELPLASGEGIPLQCSHQCAGGPQGRAPYDNR